MRLKTGAGIERDCLIGLDASWQAVKASAATASDTNLFMNSPEKQECRNTGVTIGWSRWRSLR